MERLERDDELGQWLDRLARYQYVPDLVAGRSVLEVDCGVGIGAHFLANQGAERVVGVDPSSQAIERARARYRLANLEFRCEDLAALELEDASFDLVFVPDGVRLLRRPAVLAELRRVLAADGALILAVASADRAAATGGTSYHELVDRLEAHFAPIRIVGEAPFVGLALVEYADDEPTEVDLDSSLMALRAGDDVTGYVAVCGLSAAAPRRGYTIVQLPAAPAVDVVGRSLGIGGGGAERWTRAVRERDDAEARADDLLRQLEEAQQEIGRVAAEAGRELAQARQEVSAARKRALDLEAQVAVAEEAAREAGQTIEPPRMEDLRIEPGRAPDSGVHAQLLHVDPAATVTGQIAAAMAAHQEAVRDLEERLEESAAFADELRTELDDARTKLAHLGVSVGDRERRLAAREEELRVWRQRASVAEGELWRAHSSAQGRDAKAAAAIESAGPRGKPPRAEDDAPTDRSAATPAPVEPGRLPTA
jgi:SAM-dependent methyltransferase